MALNTQENEIQYRTLTESELIPALLKNFIRRQEVTDCLRREGGRWAVRSAPFCDDWDDGDRVRVADSLRRTLTEGGFVYGAFHGDQLKGFASVEHAPLGSAGQYRDLSHLHVSAEWRGRGIGRALFARAADWARGQGGEKLYISAHSAVETQGFYCAMGCTDAQEINAAHAAAEPFDRQMECVL